MPNVRANGIDIHYLERGGGDAVVLLHGNWATSSWWEPVLDRLPRGVRAIAPDLRGRGRTVGGAADQRIETYAHDLTGLVDALGIDRFAVVGHSLGSAAAIEFALRWPERLRALVVVSPAWIDGMPASYAAPAHQVKLKEDISYMDMALRAIVPAAPRDALWDRLVREGHEQSLEAALGLIPALLEWKPGDRVGEIRVPRVVITGALDAFTGGPNAVRVANAMKCELITIEGVGHGPMLEAPDLFAKILWERLGRDQPVPNWRSPASPRPGTM